MKYVIGALQWKLPRALLPFNPALIRSLTLSVDELWPNISEQQKGLASALKGWHYSK